MQKLITVLFFFSYAFTTSKILMDGGSIHQSQPCSVKLLNTYGAEIEDSERDSMEPSELLKASCTNFEDSCCLDKEFEAMTAIAKESLQHLFNGVKETRVAVELLKKLDKKAIKNLISIYEHDELENMGLSEEQITEDLTLLKDERNDISLDLSNTYKMVEEFGGGLNCTVCEASNHSNFSNIESRDDFKMKFDFNYCYSLFNSEELISTLDFVRYMRPITTLSKMLSKLYDVKVFDHFKDSEQKVHRIDELRKSCLASVDDFSDDEQCAEMCIEIGRPNQFFFKEIIKPLTTFVVMTTDYFGSQELMQAVAQINSGEEPVNADESIMDANETIQAYADQWDVDYILPPSDDYSAIDLNTLNVELTYDNGWNFHEIRMKDWGIFTEGADILKGIVFVGLALKLFF